MRKPAFPVIRVGQGQISYRFLTAGSSKRCMIAGVVFNDIPGLSTDQVDLTIFLKMDLTDCGCGDEERCMRILTAQELES